MHKLKLKHIFHLFNSPEISGRRTFWLENLEISNTPPVNGKQAGMTLSNPFGGLIRI